MTAEYCSVVYQTVASSLNGFRYSSGSETCAREKREGGDVEIEIDNYSELTHIQPAQGV